MMTKEITVKAQGETSSKNNERVPIREHTPSCVTNTCIRVPALRMTTLIAAMGLIIP